MGISWWRLAFIFGPALARGDISSFGLYTPFIFGYLLSRVVKSAKNRTKLRGYPNKIPATDAQKWRGKLQWNVAQVFGFLGVCHYLKAETRSLFNFFLSSFVNPMLRFLLPQRNKGPLMRGKPLWDTTWGNSAVHCMILGGLGLSWWFYGIDHLFLGFLFLQAIPELQKRFWMKPMQHICLVGGILVVCFPFFSVGLMAWYFPSYLESLPKPYLQSLCWLANARPHITDYYSVLGVSPDADMKTIKKVFREQAIDLHPDKVGDDPVKLARFHAIQEASDALTKGRAEYDKSIENQELNEMVPRCYAFLIMMGYWLLHSLIDWNDVEGMRDQHKDQLRNYILADHPLDMKALGLQDDEEAGKMYLQQYCESEDVELPVCTNGDPEEIHFMRTLITDTFPGLKLKPYPKVKGKIDNLLQEIALGSKDKGENIKEINPNAGFYNGYTIKVELLPANTKKTEKVEKPERGSDESDDESEEDESKIKNQTDETTIYEYIGGDKRIAILQPPLKFRPIAGKSRFTLSKPGVSKTITALCGRLGWSGVNQVFKIGDGEVNEEFDWKLHEEEGYYNGYMFEVKENDTFIGNGRIHEYWPTSRKIILQDPLHMTSGKELKGLRYTDAEIKVVAGMTYSIYPDSLIPHRKRVYNEGTNGPSHAQVASHAIATPKNIIQAPKGAGVAAQRNVKKKMSRMSAINKKQKGGGGCVCM
mmetsp:Transcript_8374/g.16695  ORF Transcript_8374/g.16695 Transcript_8374/m.16695 type:complete len:704 (-) Transcript_8374:338-2449(-)|eukprot:CAMPEP_0181308484 /NCGR_PEP_ID=MMETSP1101-20121128/11491_1 /TAXON_ID=46948 /ORGANISM="Rhodomonas abbreviata, Strain Caron Lab Isolate" /LENGTH=703 /DNA_ID=CAMNT_0023414877 /DNA_START=138 /DNA_END=2249 /DNA_ORIENTATION=-